MERKCSSVRESVTVARFTCAISESCLSVRTLACIDSSCLLKLTSGLILTEMEGEKDRRRHW